MAENPPAEASQPPGMNGMIVTVPTKVLHEPRAPSMANFLFQKLSNSSVPNVHSQPKNQLARGGQRSDTTRKSMGHG